MTKCEKNSQKDKYKFSKRKVKIFINYYWLAKLNILKAPSRNDGIVINLKSC